jgi:hypothetical protein
MRKFWVILLVLAVAMLFGITSHHAMAKKDDCTTIQDGTIYTLDGRPIVPGYDEWGYNYQAHISMAIIAMLIETQRGVRNGGMSD